jgi:membrane associated rhomboid family serine protease
MFPIKDTIPRRQFPFITYLIIFVNTVIFIIEVILPPEILKEIFYLFGLVPARYTHLEWANIMGLPIDDYWPFFTNLFLHGSFLHFFSNMWSLYLFGDNVEDALGHIRFLIFYILCGIAANLTHFVFNINSTIPTIGASGAISGIMAAYMIMFPYSRIITFIPLLFIPFFFEIHAFFYIGIWFISQLFSGTTSLIAPELGGGIAWWAHIGGFIMGIILLPFFRKRKKDQYFDDEYFYYIFR